MASRAPLEDPDTRDIGRAWRELRRAGGREPLRSYFYGRGGAVLEVGQADTLDLLAERGECRMADLADAMRVDASTATRAVDRLEGQALVERRRLESDGRVVVAALTDAGIVRQREMNARKLEVLTEVLGEFSGEDRAVLAELLRRFVDAVDRVGAGTISRA